MGVRVSVTFISTATTIITVIIITTTTTMLLSCYVHYHYSTFDPHTHNYLI